MSSKRRDDEIVALQCSSFSASFTFYDAERDGVERNLRAMARRPELGCSSERGVRPDEGGILLQRRVRRRPAPTDRRWTLNSVPFGGRASRRSQPWVWNFMCTYNSSLACGAHPRELTKLSMDGFCLCAYLTGIE